MQFTYHKDAGTQNLKIDGDLHKYLFKVRRHGQNENFIFRNLFDDYIYRYEVINISKKDANLVLLDSEKNIIENEVKLHIAWCKIDFKSIEKVLASLNEMGVEKITFIDCEYSQRNSKINFEKIEKILINSSQQCGRSSIIKIDTCESIDRFLELYPDTYMFNFSKNKIDTVKSQIKTIMVGCEGGFNSNEVDKFKSEKIVGITSSMILRSESAVSVVAAKIIL